MGDMMEFRIMETQELVELNIYDENGTNWTSDLLGNHNDLHYNEETEEYELTTEEYEFYYDYIKNHEADVELINEVAEELNMSTSEIWETVSESMNDLEDEHGAVLSVIEQLKRPKHWLEVICDEENTTVYQIAKKAEVEKDVLYKLIQRDSEFGNISITTLYSIACGLGLTTIEFIDKYFDRFMEVK